MRIGSFHWFGTVHGLRCEFPHFLELSTSVCQQLNAFVRLNSAVDVETDSVALPKCFLKSRLARMLCSHRERERETNSKSIVSPEPVTAGFGLPRTAAIQQRTQRRSRWQWTRSSNEVALARRMIQYSSFHHDHPDRRVLPCLGTNFEGGMESSPVALLLLQ